MLKGFDMRYLKWAAAVVLAGSVAGAEVETMVIACAACHGQDGATGIAPDYPSIAGQNERYLLTQLRMIKSGERPAPLMSGQLDMVSDDDLAAMAAYYAAMPAQVGRSSADTVDAGMRIYRGGILEKGVAACTACHSPTGGGNAPAGYPHISGQRFDYVVAQLVAYREGRRKTDDAYGGMMRDVAARLTDTEIAAVANYVQGVY